MPRRLCASVDPEIRSPYVVPTSTGRSVRHPGRRTATDTERLLEQTNKLSTLNAWFEVALNNMARGLSMFDANNQLIVCNALYREIYELPEALTTPGTPLSKIVAYHAARTGSANTAEELQQQKNWIDQHSEELRHGKTFTHTQHLKNGRIVLVTNQPLADGGWVDIQEDVTESTQAEERIAWLARHCPLTEIANRFHLRERLEPRSNACARTNASPSIWIDLDHFKQVNDTFGHATGDALLKAVAKRMRSTVRDTISSAVSAATSSPSSRRNSPTRTRPRASPAGWSRSSMRRIACSERAPTSAPASASRSARSTAPIPIRC